jgi:hypothetical protein
MKSGETLRRKHLPKALIIGRPKPKIINVSHRPRRATKDDHDSKQGFQHLKTPVIEHLYPKARPSKKPAISNTAAARNQSNNVFSGVTRAHTPVGVAPNAISALTEELNKTTS